MYGKHFASTYTGSMFGAGPHVFAVWGYVIAHAYQSEVELNPALLAAILGTEPALIEKAIDYLSAPDPRSRNPEQEGRRLVHKGGFTYHVTTHNSYQSIRNSEERRAYNREAAAKHRAKKAGVNPCKTESNLLVSSVSPRWRQTVDERRKTEDGERGFEGESYEEDRAREVADLSSSKPLVDDAPAWVTERQPGEAERDLDGGELTAADIFKKRGA